MNAIAYTVRFNTSVTVGVREVNWHHTIHAHDISAPNWFKYLDMEYGNIFLLDLNNIFYRYSICFFITNMKKISSNFKNIQDVKQSANKLYEFLSWICWKISFYKNWGYLKKQESASLFWHSYGIAEIWNNTYLWWPICTIAHIYRRMQRIFYPDFFGNPYADSIFFTKFV